MLTLPNNSIAVINVGQTKSMEKKHFFFENKKQNGGLKITESL